MNNRMILTKLNLLIFYIAVILTLAGCGSQAFVESTSYKEEYIPEEDYNYRSYFWFEGSQGMVQTEDGFYFIVGSYMFFMDKTTGQSVPLCFKTDCLHNEETDQSKTVYCDAFMGSGSLFLGYSHDKLYTVCVDRNTAKTNMIEMNMDGSDRKILYPYSSDDGTSSPIILMHRGVIYFPSTMKDLEGKSYYGLNAFSTVSGSREPVLVYTGEYENGWIQNVIAFHNYIFFKDCYYTDSSFEGKIMMYDIQTGECEEILEEDCTIYGIEDGNLIIYMHNDRKYCVYSPTHKELMPSKIKYNVFLDAHPLWNCNCENQDEDIAMFSCYDREVNDFVTDLYVVNAQGEVIAIVPDAAWSTMGNYVFDDGEDIYYFRYSKTLSPFWIRGYSKSDLMQGIVNPITVIEVENYNDSFNNAYLINTSN